MSSKAHAFEPTHVFANLSPRILSSSNENKSDTQHRRVEVSGTAEFNVPPDLCVLTIVIENRKEKADEAKASVARRLDYVTQTLTNHGVQNNDMEITENLSRVNGRGFFHMEAQVDAVFHKDLQKCLQISNLFVEKLDKCVKVLPPMLKHDPQRLEVTRKQTCLTALANARQKALDVCRLMGQNLGRPVFITENVVREWRGSGAPEQVVPGAEAPLPSVDDVTNGPITSMAFANILVFVGLVSVCWGQSTCKVPVACNDGQGGTTYEWRSFGTASPGPTQDPNQPTQAPTNAPTIQSDTQSTDQNVQRLTNIITRLQEPGWISGLNGYQYYVASRGTNVGVADAQLLCQAKGGALATVGMRDPASRTHIVDNILRRCTDMHGFWIGLRKNDSGNWVYDDGVDSNALNTDWANNQPDGYNNAACTAVARYQNYKWDDVPCNANNGVLCERFAGLV